LVDQTGNFLFMGCLRNVWGRKQKKMCLWNDVNCTEELISPFCSLSLKFFLGHINSHDSISTEAELHSVAHRVNVHCMWSADVYTVVLFFVPFLVYNDKTVCCSLPSSQTTSINSCYLCDCKHALNWQPDLFDSFTYSAQLYSTVTLLQTYTSLCCCCLEAFSGFQGQGFLQLSTKSPGVYVTVGTVCKQILKCLEYHLNHCVFHCFLMWMAEHCFIMLIQTDFILFETWYVSCDTWFHLTGILHKTLPSAVLTLLHLKLLR
jgi:hypothetical protein